MFIAPCIRESSVYNLQIYRQILAYLIQILDIIFNQVRKCPTVY